MDIYEFINSKDIREHCRKLEHEFKPMEAAFLIYYSQNHSIAQKHSAWKALIEEYPDTAVEETFHCPRLDSFHKFLQEYIALEDRLLEKFFSNEENHVYTFSAAFAHGTKISDCWQNSKYAYKRETGMLYDNFTAGLEIENGYNLKYAELVNEALLFYTVEKQNLISSKGQEKKKMTVRVNKNGEPCSIEHHFNAYINEKEQDTLCRFESMWIDVPTPFKKGDILFVNHTKEGYSPDPFVLVELCTEYMNEKLKKHIDTSDMSAVGIQIIDETGHICRDNIYDYLSFEYYTEPLKKPYLILNAINRFINGKIDFDTVMEAYHYLLLKAEAE